MVSGWRKPPVIADEKTRLGGFFRLVCRLTGGRGARRAQKSTFCPGSGTITAVVADVPSAVFSSAGVPRSIGLVP